MRVLRTLALISLLIGISPVSAQVPPWQAVPIFDLTGGLDDFRDPISVDLKSASNLQNVVLTTGGVVKKREGFTNINSSAISATAAFTGLQMYRQADGDRFLIAMISDGASDGLHKMDYGAGTSGPDGTWDDIEGSLAITIDDDDQADFCQAEDQIVIEDGVTTTEPAVWTGTGDAATLGGSPGNASMCEYHKNHMVLSGRDGTLSRVYFSNINDITSWTSTDFVRVETNDGQTVTGLKSGLDCLGIWKQNSIWRMCGTDRDNFTLEQAVSGIGTCSNASIQVINNQFIFATCQGDIAIWDGGINVQIISTNIEGTLTGANTSRYDQIVSTSFDDKTGDEDYYACLSDSGSGTHNLVISYDTFHKAWVKFSGMNCNAIATYELGSLEEAIVFGDYAGFANRYPDGTSDAGSSIEAFYQSGHLRFEETPQDKTFRLAEVLLNQESGSITIQFQHRIDFESTGTTTSLSLAGPGDLWDTAVWDAATYSDLTTLIGRVEINETGRFLQWRISDDSTNTGFRIKGVRLWFEPTGRI